MQLPDFINRMLGFQTKVEAHFNAVEQLAVAQAQIATLTARVAELEAESSDFTVQNTTLTTERDSAKAAADAAVAALGAAQVANAAAIEAEKKKNIAVLADQGLSADMIPGQAPNPSASGLAEGAPKTLAEQALAAANRKAASRK